MTNDQKIKAVVESKEVIDAFKLLVAAYEDCELKHFIRVQYMVNDSNYEITFLKVGSREKIPLEPIYTPKK